MFSKTSRYANAETLVYTAPDGRQVRYLRPRILPPPDASPIQGRVAVTDATVHRLDLVAARAIGNPLLSWRLADANTAMDPLGLVAHSGRVLRVPGPPL